MHGLGDAFDALWTKDGEGHPGHLPLLGLYDCARELDILRAAVHRDDAPATIRAMLRETNWRPTLVAATAVVFLPRDATYALDLWAALDEASWASPQVAVVLALHDPDFVGRAVERVARYCPIAPGRWPKYVGKPNGKALSALVAMLEESSPADAQHLRADPDVEALIDKPWEEGRRIAAHWRERLRIVAGV